MKVPPSSLGLKIAMATAAVSLVATAAVGGASYQSGRAALVAASMQAMESEALEKEEVLTRWLHEVQQHVESHVRFPRTRTQLAEVARRGNMTGADQEALEELAIEAGAGSAFKNLFLLSAEDGRVVFSTDPQMVGIYRESAPYFQEGLKGISYQPPFFSLRFQESLIAVSAPVKDNDGVVTGVLVGQVDAHALGDALLPGPGSYLTHEVYLVDASNLLVTRPRLLEENGLLRRGVRTAAVERCLARGSGSVLAPDYGGREAVAAYRWVPALELCVIAKIDAEEALAGTGQMADSIVLAGLATASVAVAAGAGIALAIARPLGRLQEATRRLRAGESGYRVPEREGDEIDALARDFNAMAAAIEARQAEVAQRMRETEEANRELESFNYTVAHDLRAPLRAIDGYTRILTEEYAAALSAEAGRYLGLVGENARRMGALIDDLLAFSRTGQQPLHVQRVDHGALVREVVAGLAPLHRGRTVEFTIGDLPKSRGDPALLRQVWMNLLDNAVKFTRLREEARIEAGCLAEEGGPVYFVRDNGVGFDMQYAGQLFNVFQRLHGGREYEGTGVGLATVRRIVERHGGRVWAEAEEDRGAAFFFTLG